MVIRKLLLLRLMLLELLMFLIQDCRSLRSVIIHVPEVVKSGDSVTLSCEYDLEQAALYAIKWYRNNAEFYRFVPKESPPSKAFTFSFINVDVFKSGPTTVTLRNVRRELTGSYSCEVSADAPLFHTEIKTAHMTVAELPSQELVLAVQPLKAEIGKRITADCTTPGSNPVANITWYINKKKVNQFTSNVRLYPSRIEKDEALDLHLAKSKLEITVDRAHLGKENSITIRCEANIFTLWKKTADAFVQSDTPQLAPYMEPTSSQSHTGNNPGHSNKSSKFSAYTKHFLIIMYVLLLKN